MLEIVISILLKFAVITCYKYKIAIFVHEKQNDAPKYGRVKKNTHQNLTYDVSPHYYAVRCQNI